MYILDIKTGESKKISTNNEGIRDFSWSPDSKWLAFVQTAFNSMSQIIVYNIKDESKFNLTLTEQIVSVLNGVLMVNLFISYLIEVSLP
ncbi:MAG: hypothetical protein CM15mP75_0920 [Flammeovirgaceae bacterium]|nr:MAG: hypothetical protein CM15mP75_0920 [Flammeovirgaceae bacterium]